MLNGRRSGEIRADARQRPSRFESLRRFGSLAATFRRLLHLRYVRAGVAGLATGAIFLAALACTLEIRHGVSHRAVYRYLARDHFGDPDLSRLLSHPETAQRLADLLLETQSGETVGGLVHEDSGGLRFFRHRRQRDELAVLDLDTNHEIYPRLTAAYLRHDLDGLLTELETAVVRSRLEREGVSPLEVPRLRWRARNAREPRQSLALLREAGRLIHLFFPVQLDGYALPLAEKLRFYDERDPEGAFVGVFELVHSRLAGNLHETYARELAGRAHYLAVERVADGGLRIHDYYRGDRVGIYRMRPVAHPASFPLYRVEREDSTGGSLDDTA